MLLAELNIRHTRRHMPTRRVAVDHGYLPTSAAAFGGVLLGAVVSEHPEFAPAVADLHTTSQEPRPSEVVVIVAVSGRRLKRGPHL